MIASLRHVVSENPVTGFAFALFSLLVLAALVGPQLAPFDPLASDTMASLRPPNGLHWFGNDQLGRDIFSRCLVAARLDLSIAGASVALVFLVGGFAGLTAGFYGSWVDMAVGRVADTVMAFPLFVLAVGIVAVLGNTVPNIVLATAIINFPLYVRVAQAKTVVRREAGLGRRAARDVAVEMLRQVGIPDPARRAGAYPFQLSGGTCQRVMIAVAVAARPALLIADEPSTGLDVTTQALVMDLIAGLAAANGMATALITHDLALAAERAQRIAVMHAGHIVETAGTRDRINQPSHPYTQVAGDRCAALAPRQPA